MFKNETLLTPVSSDPNRSDNSATPLAAVPDFVGREDFAELLDFADVVGEVALTLERAYEFPGKLADARKLRQRLVLRSARIEQRILHCRQQLKLAHDSGHEFLEHKMRSALRSLEEERMDGVALMEEVKRVFHRLKRERRSLLYRIDCAEALVRSLPTPSRRASVKTLFDEARRVVSLA